MMHGMVIDLEEAPLQTLAQVKEFLDQTHHLTGRGSLYARNSATTDSLYNLQRIEVDP